MLHKRLFEPVRRGGSVSAALADDGLGELVTSSTGLAVFPLDFACDGSGHVMSRLRLE